MDSPARLKRVVLLAAISASFLTPFMGSAVHVAIPSMATNLALDPVRANWIVTAYLLASAVFLLPFGRAADIYGRKKMFLTGLAGYTGSSLLCGLADSFALLIAGRIAQGVASAMIFSTGIAILTSVFPPGERGRALGLTVAAVYTGLSIGPPVGGAVTHHLGWSWIFHVNFGMGLVVLWIVVVHLKGEWKVEAARRYDLAGALLYGTGLAGALYGLATLNATAQGWTVMAAGAALLAAFILWELRFPEPLLDLSLFRNAVFAFSNLAALIHYSATFGVALVLAWYLQGAKGLDPQSAGLVLLCQPVMMALMSPLAGRLSDRFEPRLIASAGMALTSAGVFLLSLLDGDSRVAWVMADLLFIGFGYAFFSSPNTNAIMSSVERARYGVASAAVGTMRLIGQATSVAIVTFIFALYLKGNTGLSAPVPGLLQSQRLCFLVFGGLCLAGVFASLARGRARA